MPDAVGLHRLQFAGKFFGKGLRDFLADADALLEILRRVRARDFRAERRFQFVEILRLQVDPRRLGVPAEFSIYSSNCGDRRKY